MRQPYTIWKVGEKEYKLKLTTADVCSVEKKLGENILKLFMPKFDGDVPLPPLNDTLIVIHGAMRKFNSKMSFTDVQDLFDIYMDNDKSQMELMSDVILPLLENSGFMPKEKKTEVNED